MVSSVSVGKAPLFATYDSGNGYVYVPNSMSGNVSVLNGTMVVGAVVCGFLPSSTTYDPGDGYIYVTNVGSDSVTVISGVKDVGTLRVGASPRYGSYDSGNGYVYVSNSGSGNVSVINGTLVVGSISVGSSPSSLTYDTANGLVYVPNTGSDNVSVINGTELVGTVTVGTGPGDATYDDVNGYVYITNSASFNVSVVNGTTVVGSVAVGVQPDSATYDEHNGYIYVANKGNPTVSVLRGTTVVKTVDVWTEPTSPAYDSGNGYVYVPNYGSGNLSVLNGTTVIGTLEVGTAPDCSVYDSENGYVYVPNFGSDNVSILIISYAVTFTQTGLPTGAGWWVNATGGSVNFSTASTLYFNESHGTYWYSISTIAKNYSSPRGSFNLAGMPVSVTVPFSLISYIVAFTETGLPSGTNWSVTLGDVAQTSNMSSIDFQEPNGTHAYRIGAIPGWRTASYAGSLTVRGGAAPTTVLWVQATYVVGFTERGLPTSTEWWVNLTSGESTNSFGRALSFSVPNGSYAYSIASLDKSYTSQGGSFSVDGTSVSEKASFSLSSYAVVFSESGLPSETGWWVNVTGGPSTFSTTESLSFDESNGTYSYSVAATNRNYSSPQGGLTVDGSAVSKTVVFALTAFPVTFTESGLPSGTSWSVTFRGATASGTENLEFATVPNGTYAFTVGSVAGYTSDRTSGTVTVHGAPASEPLTFAATTVPPSKSTSPATFLGLPATEGYAVLGGVIITILAATAVVVQLRRRGGKAPHEPAKPPADSCPGEPPASP